MNALSNGHPLRVTTAAAIEQSLITCIPKAAMIATLHDEVGFSELFMADLLNRNSRIEEDLIDQLFNSSEKRLARVLLLLANFGEKATVEPIIGKFSQDLTLLPLFYGAMGNNGPHQSRQINFDLRVRSFAT